MSLEINTPPFINHFIFIFSFVNVCFLFMFVTVGFNLVSVTDRTQIILLI